MSSFNRDTKKLHRLIQCLRVHHSGSRIHYTAEVWAKNQVDIKTCFKPPTLQNTLLMGLLLADGWRYIYIFIWSLVFMLQLPLNGFLYHGWRAFSALFSESQWEMCSVQEWFVTSLGVPTNRSVQKLFLFSLSLSLSENSLCQVFNLLKITWKIEVPGATREKQ